MPVPPARSKDSPEARLRALVAKFPPKAQTLIRAVRAAVRKRVPTANELVYDYRGKLVLGYTPTEHGKDGVLSIAADTTGVRLYLNGAPGLPDPKKLLMGSAGTRYLVVEEARRLAHPDVQALVAAALARSAIPLPATGRGRLIDRSAAQTARRKGAK